MLNKIKQLSHSEKSSLTYKSRKTILLIFVEQITKFLEKNGNNTYIHNQYRFASAIISASNNSSKAERTSLFDCSTKTKSQPKIIIRFATQAMRTKKLFFNLIV